MDNKENTLKQKLDAENQEWLEQLLNGTSAPAAEKEAPQQDTQLDRILNEDWISGNATPVAPKTAAPVDDAFIDDFDFDALLAADTLTDKPQAAPTPVAKPAPVVKPAAPVERPAPVAKPTAPVTKPAPVKAPTPVAKPAPAARPTPAAKPAAPVERPAPVVKPAPAKAPVRQTRPAPNLKKFTVDRFTKENSAQAGPNEEWEDAPIEKKGRPKRQPGYGLFGIPHIVSTLIWLALILVIGVSLGRTLWVYCADVMAFGKEAKTVTITITEDDTIDTIAKKLGDADLVRYPDLFKFFADVTGKSDNIGTGTFSLNAQLDYNAMINAMYDYGPEQQVVTLMFPEGYNCAQIFKLLEENEVCTMAELEEYSMTGELQEYWFLEGVSRDSKYCLEGYLAPDTYKFYVGDSPRRVLEKFLDEFDQRFTDRMKEDFEEIKETYANRLKKKGYSEAYIEEHALTIQDVITLASVIQKETASDGECYDIASTFYNRLVANMRLDADATVYYAIGDYFWETEELTQEHLSFDSPYNTRKNGGIPPTPICNMGVHALYAALEPNETGYYYFVYDSAKGAHRFAETEAEHINNLRELGY